MSSYFYRFGYFYAIALALSLGALLL